MSIFGGRSIGHSISNLFSGGNSRGTTGTIKSIRPDYENENAKFVMESIKKSDTFLGEIMRTVDDTKNEFHEICTDGFYEIVIKGNKDYKTSYEIRDEANEIIGKESNKYKLICERFNEYLTEFNNLINNLNDKKLRVATILGRKIKGLTNMPKVDSNLYLPKYECKKSTINDICNCLSGSDFLNMRYRKECSNEYLEDAKDFQIYVYKGIAAINRTEVYLETIKINLKEEEQLIDILSDSLQKEWEDYKCLLIHKELNILLTEYILDSDGNKNKKYFEALSELKKIIGKL